MSRHFARCACVGCEAVREHQKYAFTTAGRIAEQQKVHVERALDAIPLMPKYVPCRVCNAPVEVGCNLRIVATAAQQGPPMPMPVPTARKGKFPDYRQAELWPMRMSPVRKP